MPISLQQSSYVDALFNPSLMNLAGATYEFRNGQNISVAANVASTSFFDSQNSFGPIADKSLGMTHGYDGHSERQSLASTIFAAIKYNQGEGWGPFNNIFKGLISNEDLNNKRKFNKELIANILSLSALSDGVTLNEKEQKIQRALLNALRKLQKINIFSERRMCTYLNFGCEVYLTKLSEKIENNISCLYSIENISTLHTGDNFAKDILTFMKEHFDLIQNIIESFKHGSNVLLCQQIIHTLKEAEKCINEYHQELAPYIASIGNSLSINGFNAEELKSYIPNHIQQNLKARYERYNKYIIELKQYRQNPQLLSIPSESMIGVAQNFATVIGSFSELSPQQPEQAALKTSALEILEKIHDNVNSFINFLERNKKSLKEGLEKFNKEDMRGCTTSAENFIQRVIKSFNDIILQITAKDEEIQRLSVKQRELPQAEYLDKLHLALDALIKDLNAIHNELDNYLKSIKGISHLQLARSQNPNETIIDTKEIQDSKKQMRTIQRNILKLNDQILSQLQELQQSITDNINLFKPDDLVTNEAGVDLLRLLDEAVKPSQSISQTLPSSTPEFTHLKPNKLK